MATKNSWTINCLIAGVETYRLILGGKEDLAREKIRDLSSELSSQEIDYSMMRLKKLARKK